MDEKETSLADLALPNRLASLKYANDFHRVFGQCLNSFWDGNLLGLDIIGFDKWLCPDNDMSTADAVQQKYGDEGTAIIKGLLLIND